MEMELSSGVVGLERIEQNDSIAARIAEKILSAIQDGHFPVGEKLPTEAEFSRHFGVSRPTVREAMGALQFAGYIDSVRGLGKTVISKNPGLIYAAQKDLGIPDVLALFEARLLTEPSVIALAARDPEPKALAAAEVLIHGMSIAVEEPSIGAMTDLRVHAAIAKICRNTYMVENTLRLLDLAGAPVLTQARERAWSNHGLVGEWATHHTAVIDAIVRRDEKEAAFQCWHHLASATQNVLDALKELDLVGDKEALSLTRFIEQHPLNQNLRIAPKII